MEAKDRTDELQLEEAAAPAKAHSPPGFTDQSRVLPPKDLALVFVG